jgi:Leucine-rich repeat (LRR) protein
MTSKLESVIQSIGRGDTITHVDLSNAGLAEFPPELRNLRDTLEVLNLGGNGLSSLPEYMTEFKKLKILFFAQNKFEEIPVQLGMLPSLYMLSFKSNRIKYIAPLSLTPSLSWLILTDNLIEGNMNNMNNMNNIIRHYAYILACPLTYRSIFRQSYRRASGSCQACES